MTLLEEAIEALKECSEQELVLLVREGRCSECNHLHALHCRCCDFCWVEGCYCYGPEDDD